MESVSKDLGILGIIIGIGIIPLGKLWNRSQSPVTPGSESESKYLGNPGLGIIDHWNQNWNHYIWKTLESELESESQLVESESAVVESFTTLYPH